MKNSSLWKACVLTGISLGTAWAIRGHFGHEQGAIWAGAIGVLALLLVANRADWFSRTFRILLAGGIGWGIGGIMSYGLLVGYGHATDYLNASYGLLMLFVVGALHGYLGGGLLGLALAESDSEKIDWSRLIIEMAVGGILGYFFLIEQFGWLMTPPRDENWAACMGAALMLGWHIYRKGNHNVLKVALWSALGAGFGFATGNFYQVMGRTLEINFNMWNVMEYSIGFWGGIGMTYGILTSVWPESTERKPINYQKFGIIFFTLIIPFIVWDQSFTTRRLDRIYSAIGHQEMASMVQMLPFILIPSMVFYWYKRWFANQQLTSKILDRKEVLSYFLTYLGWYTFISLLVKGAFFSTEEVEQYLYIVNFIVIYIFISKNTDNSFTPIHSSYRKISVFYLIAFAIILLIAAIAFQSHGEMKGMELRFK